LPSEKSNFELPKLPQLNEEDVKAVRSFLPGKLLGRTAAILSLVPLILGFLGLVGGGTKYVFKVDLPWWGYGILLALALLAVAAQVLSEWVELGILIGANPEIAGLLCPRLDSELSLGSLESFCRASRIAPSGSCQARASTNREVEPSSPLFHGGFRIMGYAAHI
jgi:hypothetical protein